MLQSVIIYIVFLCLSQLTFLFYFLLLLFIVRLSFLSHFYILLWYSQQHSLDIVILNIIHYHNYHVYRFCVFKRSAFLPFMLCDVYIFLVMLQLWFPDSYCQVKKFRLMMILGRTLKYIVNIKNQKEIKEGNITENQSKKIFQLRKNILTVMSQNQGQTHLNEAAHLYYYNSQVLKSIRLSVCNQWKGFSFSILWIFSFLKVQWKGFSFFDIMHRLRIISLSKL